jgi:(2R)-sulfolactate sulfo-lyase subunit alpha
LDANKKISIRALEDIPLGHKIALRTLGQGETAIKYGHDIGRIIRLVKAGRLVHVHNLKTKRW